MTKLISWKKPKQINAPSTHAEKHSSDSLIPGTFVPNMSEEDVYKWKGKLRGQRSKSLFIELRKSFSLGNCHAQVLIVVATNGYKLSKHDTFCKTKDVNVRVSTNGPIALTFLDFEEFYAVIQEAKSRLLDKENDEGKTRPICKSKNQTRRDRVLG